jgi:hypothetical protein
MSTDTPVARLTDMSEPSHAVDIAVLYERLGNLSAQIEALGVKIDRQSAHRDEAIAELEERVERIEDQVTRARGFLAGLAMGGGLLGGLTSTLLTHWMG